MGQWKFVLDMDSLSHWGLIIVPGLEVKGMHLGYFFNILQNNGTCSLIVLIRITPMRRFLWLYIHNWHVLWKLKNQKKKSRNMHACKYLFSWAVGGISYGLKATSNQPRQTSHPYSSHWSCTIVVHTLKHIPHPSVWNICWLFRATR